MQYPDVYGEALTDYYYTNNTENELILHTNQSETEVMPVDLFFRSENDFPDQELIALALCDGKVLDIGAGAGSHALYLQTRGMDVTALEVSAKACEIMKLRGVKSVIQEDIFSYNNGKYDTLLFLMNGIGLAESIDGLKRLFNHCKTLLNPGGQLLFDSSDISYYYDDGIQKPNHYYGEINFQYEYKGQKGKPFGWIYIDQQELIKVGNENGWVVQILDEDDHYQYLVRMELKSSF
ncbi:class I SAM-dependent methyltransferase [Albibacterium sp.]|uniref:class I SAM-dependent methyltransferase n=1 Tax=Albibacterium sp. TaxID=2952885 RepID=UPI002CB20DC9|nr:class I SAM-dependent methyltransferase [Albibacterium sp.]HUH18580.1 class I SAM-dependent methyltransferase [Albibacterium sp.]